MMVKVKICGTVDRQAALIAERAGADYLGVLVDIPFSERSVTIERACEIRQGIGIPLVLLCFDRDEDGIERIVERLTPAAVQLLGHEPPERVERLRQRLQCEIWKTLFLPERQHVPDRPALLETTLRQNMRRYADAGADKLLLDTLDVTGGRFGGTGKPNDWAMAARLIRQAPLPTFLSGGLHAGNVALALQQVRPYGIDLCSGVESARGKRDPKKVEALMAAVRRCFVDNQSAPFE